MQIDSYDERKEPKTETWGIASFLARDIKRTAVSTVDKRKGSRRRVCLIEQSFQRCNRSYRLMGVTHFQKK